MENKNKEKEKVEQAGFEKVLTLPFIKGFLARMRRELSKERVNVVFKNGRTLEKCDANSAQNTQGTIQRQHLLEEMQQMLSYIYR